MNKLNVMFNYPLENMTSITQNMEVNLLMANGSILTVPI